MNLQHRIDLIVRLGEYLLSDDPQWQASKEKASRENAWFIPEFIDLSVRNIAHSFLKRELLEKWTAHFPDTVAKLSRGQDGKIQPVSVGIVMAGNIPLVGFHDFLSVFISGHKAIIKPSSKDNILIRHLVGKLVEWDAAVAEWVGFSEMLKKCDAYIATGSNYSSRYFDYYFEKYPHIIRRNRTSVAILTGEESLVELDRLADDVYIYFGLGCRNVTKLFAPEGYDFVPLLKAFKKYNHLADHHKYRNNYDYNLAIHLLNKKYYMSNESILLVEEKALFSPISQLNFSYYKEPGEPEKELANHPDLQCIVGRQHIPFGQGQYPGLTDYADGVNTLAFLTGL